LPTFIDEILHEFLVFDVPGLNRILEIKWVMMFSAKRINSVFDPSFVPNTPLPAETALAEDGLPLLAPDDL
jgi:hypothetical protein